MKRTDRVTRPGFVRAVEQPIAAVNRAANQKAKGIAAAVMPFYRRFPYTGPLGLFMVDPRGAYSPRDSFFFNRIPKAANSTVMATLAEHARFRRRFADGHPKRMFLRPLWLTSAEVAHLAGDTFRFTFVRDPYRRALSAFADKILGLRKQSRPFYDWFGGVGEKPPDFVDFLRYLDDGGLLRDPHWAPQTHLLLMPLAAFDFVGRVETLEADLGHVLRTIFMLEGPVEIRRGGPRTDSHRLHAQAYTPEALALVNRLYAEDFELLGYAPRSG